MPIVPDCFPGLYCPVCRKAAQEKRCQPKEEVSEKRVGNQVHRRGLLLGRVVLGAPGMHAGGGRGCIQSGKLAIRKLLA